MSQDPTASPIPPERALPLYANEFEVAFNAFEFRLRFSDPHALNSPARVEIVTTPAGAEQFLALLTRCVGAYKEEQAAVRGVPPSLDPPP